MAIKFAPPQAPKRDKDGMTKLERQKKLLAGEIPLKAAVPATLPADAPNSISAMVADAARKLATARTAAEVLDAKDSAGAAYEAAKIAARFAKVKGAADKVIAAAHRAQADALDIEAQAKRRLADEYDGAQERGEVAKGRPKTIPDGNTLPTVTDIGMTSKEIMDARQIRDAIAANPSIVREVLSDMLERGDEPTRAALKREIAPVAKAIHIEKQTEKKERRENDFYPSPVSLITEIVSRWKPTVRTIWEPCVGDGRVASALRVSGYEVITGDITQGADFFAYDALPLPGIALCTNPPFGRMREFIDHAFKIGVREMCLVLPERAWASGIGREQFERHRPAIWANMDWREDYLGIGGSPDRALAVAIWDQPCAPICRYEVWDRRAAAVRGAEVEDAA